MMPERESVSKTAEFFFFLYRRRPSFHFSSLHLIFQAVKGYFKALSLLDQVMRFLVILTFKRNSRRNPTILPLK